MVSFFLIALATILGLCIGSALNVWLWRSEHHELAGRTRSACPSCHTTLRWFELIPLVSFIVQHGRCRTCSTAIPYWYPVTEALGAAAGGLSMWFGLAEQYSPVALFVGFIFALLLVAIALYDALYHLIPLILVAGGGTLALLQAFILDSSPLSILIGAGGAASFFLLQYLLSRGRWIGSGDIYLGLMLGAWLGSPRIVLALWLAYVLGAIYGIYLKLRQGAANNTPVPFGTFLCLGTFIAWIGGGAIIDAYLSLMGW